MRRPSPEAPARHVEALREAVERGLAGLAFPAEPAALYEPARYALEGGGKRIRPVLLLLAAEAFGAPTERALPAALAAEVFHTFTLVHDDIMDRAPTRRGRPTVHVRWSEGTAILVGDLLMGTAYELLARTETARLPEMLRAFHRMMLRLCEGQTLDESLARAPEATLEAYLDMIDRKTGALLEAALEIGTLVGGGDAEARATMRRAGRALGRAFQIQDDLLDLTAEGDGWGKAIGGDLVEGKKTFLLLSALEHDGNGWFRRIVREGGLPPEEVPEARRRMEALGVLEAAREAVGRYASEGEAALGALPEGPAAEALLWLARSLAHRDA